MNEDNTQDTKIQGLKPIYIRASDVTALYGIRKSFLFRLVESGALKSILLKGRGQMRGIRLFRAEDIQALIDKAGNNHQS
jgi:hypothetical protein